MTTVFKHNLSRFVLIGLSLLAFVSCKKSKYDSEYIGLKFDGKKRCYLLHVPDSYEAATSTPLIIALHGGVGSARNIEEQSGLAEFSDEKGFILASPNGHKRTWNAGWCCGKAAEKEIDDVGFINAMIDEITGEYNIDENRIYVTGMSNGAMMSYRLACELGDRIAAIAPVAGSMVMSDCVWDQSVSVIHFHSFQDASVPHDGGIGDGISDHYNSPLDSVSLAIASQMSCSMDTVYQDANGVEFWHWSACSDSSEVMYVISPDGGHSWPGGAAPYRKADEPSALVNANELMWEFFMRHPKK